MPIIDNSNFLSDEEIATYHKHLKNYGHEPHHFLIEVVEDQGSMDMNDINYIIIVKTKATHLKNQKSKTYSSRVSSGTWLAEFEEDLKEGYFNAQ